MRFDVEENVEGSNCALCKAVILKNSNIREKWLELRVISGVLQILLVFALNVSDSFDC